jgi:hypothetical protein
MASNLKQTEWIIISLNLLLYSMSITALGILAFHVRDAFVNHLGAAEDVAFYLLTPIGSGLTLSLIRDVMTILMVFLADCILVTAAVSFSVIILLTSLCHRYGECWLFGHMTGK